MTVADRPGGRVLRQRAATSVAAAASKGASVLMGTAMAVYVGRAGGSPLAVGLVLAVFFGGQMLCSPLWGAVGDVTGRRRDVLVVGSLLAAVAVVPLVVVTGVWVPIGVRAVYSLFAAVYLPILFSIASAEGGTTGRGRSLGLLSSAGAVGFTAGQVAAGALLGLLAPSALYVVVAGASLLVAVAALAMDDPTPTPADPALSVREVATAVRGRLVPSAAGRAQLRRTGLGPLYLAVFLRNATVIGTSSLLPVYLVGQVGVTEAVMGVLLAVNPATQVPIMYVVGGLADRVGRRPLVVLGMAGSGLYALVMAAAVVPGTFAARVALVAVGMIVVAASFSGTRVGAVAYIADVSPAGRESELIGLRSTARGFGGATGPALVGAAALVTSIETAFAAASLLAFAAALLVSRTLSETAPVAVAGNEGVDDAVETGSR